MLRFKDGNISLPITEAIPELMAAPDHISEKSQLELSRFFNEHFSCRVSICVNNVRETACSLDYG